MKFNLKRAYSDRFDNISTVDCYVDLNLICIEINLNPSNSIYGNTIAYFRRNLNYQHEKSINSIDI